MIVPGAAEPPAGPALEPAARARLERYVGLVLEHGAALNLTAARTAEAVADHIADSLAVVPYLGEPFVDVGSGAGFPAVPVAIATGFRGTLIEATGKKARFLATVVAALGLPLEVIAMRAEDAARDGRLRAGFASATARAVSNLSTVLELTLPFLAVDGVAALQRGAVGPHERTAAHDAALVLGARIERDIALAGTRERRIIIVRKTAPTGQRFPRRAGIPAKRPLCFAGDSGAADE